MGILDGKVALVTGGTTGIGRASAELFRDEGARVMITGQNPATLEQARRELPDDVLVVRADARSLRDAENVARTAELHFGAVDIVFLNAGIARVAPFENLDEGFYDEQMDINVKGLVFTFQALVPLLNAGASVIVNTSIANHKGSPQLAIYAASKGALAALVRSWAIELSERSVRVNAISPGAIRTPIRDKFGVPAADRADGERELCARIPLGRLGESHEVAQVALFLASHAASYVTGTEIPVDGGLLVV